MKRGWNVRKHVVIKWGKKPNNRNNSFITKCITLFNLLPGEEPDDADLDAPKVYEMIETFEQLSDRLISYQQQYNETIRGAAMDLVFFKVRQRVIMIMWVCGIYIKGKL